jgi:hypothetical protein
MRNLLIAAFVLAFAGQIVGQNPSGQSPAPSYPSHHKAKIIGQAGSARAPQPVPSQSAQPSLPDRPQSVATQGPATHIAAPQPQAQPQSSTTPARQTTELQQTSQPLPKIPASVPRVSFQNGELTVLAQNSSLGEVLNAVRAATGMKIEGSSGSAERVTAKIGPASVRDVLLSLLEGSKYDFAMLGSVTDPQRVERLVLSPRTASSGSISAPQQPAPQTDSDNAMPPQPGDDDDDSEGFAPAKPAPTTQAPPNTPAPAQVKTPEQLLEDLRRLESDKAQQQATRPADPNAPRPARPERPK